MQKNRLNNSSDCRNSNAIVTDKDGSTGLSIELRSFKWCTQLVI